MLPQYLVHRLQERYKESHRAYHTIEHVRSLIAWMKRVHESLSNPEVFEAAIWFHDVIYDPLRNDNEERSADLAKEWLAGVYESDVIEEIVRFVLATKTHACSNDIEDADLRLFLDADMSILGAKSEPYRSYVKQVRQEYAQVPEALFAEKRKAVVQGWLGLAKGGCLFLTSDFGHGFGLNAQAIENLEWELECAYV